MKVNELLEGSKSALQTLLAEIAKACGASKPTAKSTSETYGGITFTSPLKMTAQDHGANNYLKKLGFVQADIKADGGSSRGDFSSDRYGYTFKHPDGVKVTVQSNFRDRKPTFEIHIQGHEESVKEILNSQK